MSLQRSPYICIDNNISKAHLFKTASKFLTNKHTKKKRVPEHFDPRDFPTDAQLMAML